MGFGTRAAGGDTAEDFVYDALGRLTEATDDDSTVQMTYDSLSRVLTEVQGSNPLGTTGKTVSFTWNAESHRTEVDYPSGFDANEARDELGRPTAISDGSSNTVASFDLYGAGLRETVDARERDVHRRHVRRHPPADRDGPQIFRKD